MGLLMRPPRDDFIATMSGAERAAFDAVLTAIVARPDRPPTRSFAAWRREIPVSRWGAVSLGPPVSIAVIPIYGTN